jgi:2-dehydropantoate 2-reductase
LIAGAGAVGCVLGGALLRNGHEAVFLARGNNLAGLRNHGLHVRWPEQTWSWPAVRAIAADDSVESFDAILFCVKGYDWERAADELKRFPSPWILTFQNGVYVHREMSKQVAGSVCGSVIYVAADRTEPGVVVVRGKARVVMDGSEGSRGITSQLEKALAVPEMKIQLSDNIELDLWRKYLFLCSFSAVNTLTEKPCDAILQDPDVKDLWIRMMREIAAVGRACGVAVGDADVETSVAGAAKFPPGTSSSLLADTLRKQNTEVELLQGYLVRLASSLSIDVPVARILYSLLKLKTRH